MPNTEYKQVGRNCLADFIACDPHAAAEQAEILVSVGAFASACEDEEFLGAGGSSNIVSIGSYLPYVAHAIRVGGWLSKGKAWEQGNVELATAIVSRNAMLDHESLIRQGRTPDSSKIPNEKDREVASKAIAFCNEYFENANPATLSDYEHNLRVAMQTGVCEARTFGIVASAINFAARTQEKASERVDFANSQFVGEIGKRAVFQSLKCVFPGFGGRPVVFVDPNGNKVSAWNPGFKVEKGETYTVKATPVKQDEYKGIKSTMLNRMVLATEKDLAPKAPRKPRAKKATGTSSVTAPIVKCEDCAIWEQTGRPCTVSSHGECDCPKCQGMCKCQ